MQRDATCWYTPPRESKSKSCAFGSGTVTFQGGSFQEKTAGLIGPRSLRILIGRNAVGWPCMECHVPCRSSIYWVWDSVKQSEGWGKNPALIARSPTRHSNMFIEKFHHKSSLLVWLPNTNPTSQLEIRKPLNSTTYSYAVSKPGEFTIFAPSDLRMHQDAIMGIQHLAGPLAVPHLTPWGRLDYNCSF